MRYSAFPRMGHLPGSSHTPEDVLLSLEEAAEFLRVRTHVIEKLDGINVSLRRTGAHRVEVGLKIEWTRALGGRVKSAVDIWVRQHESQLTTLLAPGDTLYGEWLWHEVAVPYDRLPALLVGFGLYRGDAGGGTAKGPLGGRGRFIPFDEMAAAVRAVGLEPARSIFRGKLKTLDRVKKLVSRSNCGPHRMEGVIAERLDDGWPRWCKWVEADYAHPVPGRISGRKNRVARR